MVIVLGVVVIVIGVIDPEGNVPTGIIVLGGWSNDPGIYSNQRGSCPSKSLS